MNPHEFEQVVFSEVETPDRGAFGRICSGYKYGCTTAVAEEFNSRVIRDDGVRSVGTLVGLHHEASFEAR